MNSASRGKKIAHKRTTPTGVHISNTQTARQDIRSSTESPGSNIRDIEIARSSVIRISWSEHGPFMQRTQEAAADIECRAGARTS